MTQLTITDNNGNISPDIFEVVGISLESSTIHRTGQFSSENKIHLKTTYKNFQFLNNIGHDKIRRIEFFQNQFNNSLYGCLIVEMSVDEYGSVDVFLVCDYYQVDENIKVIRKMKLDAIQRSI